MLAQQEGVLVYNLGLTHLLSCSLVVMATNFFTSNVDTIIHSHPETKDQCICYTRFGCTDCTDHRKLLKEAEAGGFNL